MWITDSKPFLWHNQRVWGTTINYALETKKSQPRKHHLENIHPANH